MILSREAYDDLCIHGPGSPDRCGHPDCTGARWVTVKEDRVDIWHVEPERSGAKSEPTLWPHTFHRLGWRWWLCRYCYAPKSMHPRLHWVRKRADGDRSYLSANAPHFKEGW